MIRKLWDLRYRRMVDGSLRIPPPKPMFWLVPQEREDTEPTAWVPVTPETMPEEDKPLLQRDAAGVIRIGGFAYYEEGWEATRAYGIDFDADKWAGKWEWAAADFEPDDFEPTHYAELPVPAKPEDKR